jgi:hypothetical protein
VFTPCWPACLVICIRFASPARPTFSSQSAALPLADNPALTFPLLFDMRFVRAAFRLRSYRSRLPPLETTGRLIWGQMSSSLPTA